MNPTDYLEIISDGDLPLAYIVSRDWTPDATTFLTPDTLPMQMGMIVRAKDETIVPHVHLPITRSVEGTSECIIVRKGCCEIDFFNARKEFIATRELSEGTIVLLLGGGHGFRMTQDTLLFEIKQGPFAGTGDKSRF